MIWIILGVVAYIAITCVARRLNVIDYVRENKLTLVLTTLIVLAIHVFGKVASTAVLVAFLMPIMAAYSIPSLLAKAKEIWLRVQGWFSGMVGNDPDEA